MIAAIRNTVAAMSRIVFWPLTMLAKSIAKANLKIIRWAIRHNVGGAYLFAILWAPTLSVAGFGWLLASAPAKPTTLAIFGVSLLVVNKALGIVLYLSGHVDRSLRALRFYRRHF